MNSTGMPRKEGWAELCQRGLDDKWRWDKVDHCDEEIHIVQALELRCFIRVGDIIRYKNSSYEICRIWYAYNTGDGRSILLYAHPTKVEVQPMTEDDWHELYGHLDLASGH